MSDQMSKKRVEGRLSITDALSGNPKPLLVIIVKGDHERDESAITLHDLSDIMDVMSICQQAEGVCQRQGIKGRRAQEAGGAD